MLQVKPASSVATLAPPTKVPTPTNPGAAPWNVPGKLIECEVATERPVPSALKVRVPMMVPESCVTKADPVAGITGLMLTAVKPVLDCRQLVVPLIAQRPTMLASVSWPSILRIFSSPARRAAISACSAAPSPIGTQVILRPLGSDDCIACPAGQPFTACAATLCAPSARAIAANVLPQTLLMFPPLVG